MGLTTDALNRVIESQIFFPDPYLVATPMDEGLEFEDLRFKTRDGITLHGWLVPAEASIGLILFCHGNAGNISHRVDNIRRLHDIGLSVLIFDYRGYGLSGGRITESGFYLDAEAAYEIAREHAARENLKLILFGRSLGGIAAGTTWLRRAPVRALSLNQLLPIWERWQKCIFHFRFLTAYCKAG